MLYNLLKINKTQIMKHTHIINHVVFAKQRRVIENKTITIDNSISNYVIEGEYDILCSFIFSEEGRYTCVEYSMTGEITLECQNNLSAFPHKVDLSGSMIIVADDRDAEDSPHEPFISTVQEIDLADIIKEEIILSIPLVPKKDTNACKKQKKHSYYGGLKIVIEEKKNPFDILKNLK